MDGNSVVRDWVEKLRQIASAPVAKVSVSLPILLRIPLSAFLDGGRPKAVTEKRGFPGYKAFSLYVEDLFVMDDKYHSPILNFFLELNGFLILQKNRIQTFDGNRYLKKRVSFLLYS